MDGVKNPDVGRLPWIIRVGPESITSVLRKRSRRSACTQRRQRLGGAATSQGHVEPPKGGRGRRDPPRELMDGAQPCPHPDFGLLAPRTRRDYVFVVLSHSVCGRLSQQT